MLIGFNGDSIRGLRFLFIYDEVIELNKRTQWTLLCLLGAILLLQGGYNSSISFIASFFLLFIIVIDRSKFEILNFQRNISMAAMVFLGLISSFACGYGSYSLAHLAPYCMFLSSSFVFTSVDDFDFNYLIGGLRYICFISSAAAILLFFVFPSFFGYVSAGRLQAFFQYANTAAIWFALSFLLLLDSPLFTKIDCLVPFIALVLTRSVAVAILVVIGLMIYLILEKRSMASFLLAVFGLVLILCIYDMMSGRIVESVQTFIERIIQIYDGLRLAGSSPFIGIGPGAWRQSYRFVQSAQYSANVIHCGYLQILLDGGIFALTAFLWFCITRIICIFKERSNIPHSSFVVAGIVLMLLHFMVDIDIQFGFIDLLLVLFLSRGNEKYSIKELSFGFTNWANKGCLLLCLSIIFGLTIITCYRSYLIEVGDRGPSCFEKDPEVSENYLLRLCDEGEYASVVDTADSLRLRSVTSELQLLKIGSLYCMDMRDDAEECLLELIDMQKKNVDLYKTATAYFDYYGISNEGRIRLTRIENQANEMIERPPASYLRNQVLYEWTQLN